MTTKEGALNKGWERSVAWERTELLEHERVEWSQTKLQTLARTDLKRFIRQGNVCHHFWITTAAP